MSIVSDYTSESGEGDRVGLVLTVVEYTRLARLAVIVTVLTDIECHNLILPC